jgi:signal transduction histidine kinase
MELLSKYNRINIILMSLLFLCSGAATLILVRGLLIHELDEVLADYKDRIEHYMDVKGTLPESDTIDETIINYQVTTHTAKDKFSFTELREPDEDKTHTFRQLTFTKRNGNVVYKFTIAKPLEGTRMLTRIIVATTVVLLLFVILCSVLLNRIILRKIWAPFYETIHKLKGIKISKGDRLTLSETNIDEFRFLNNTLEQTINFAEQEYRILKEFTENASHEMQTPLAIVRSKLDLVIQQEGLSDTQADAIKSAYSGITRLDKLNRSLLLLAKIENRQFQDTSMLNLKNKVDEKLEQLKEIMQESSVKVTSELKGAVISCNEMLLEILLNNLVSNAVRHNTKDGEINISLKPGVFRISNTGSPVSLNKERIFRRFYKDEQHSTQHGLGLAIIKQIAEQSDIRVSYDWQNSQHVFTLEWEAPLLT